MVGTASCPAFPSNGGFAIDWQDDGTSKTYIRSGASNEWLLLNDSAKTLLELVPIAVSRDGVSGFLQSQRKTGPDVVERYEFATGKRVELYADKQFD